MVITVITGVVLTVVAVVSLIVAIHQYRINHSDHKDAKLKNAVRQVASEVNEPLRAAQNTTTTQLARQNDRLDRIEDLQRNMNGTLEKVVESQAKMSVKVDAYWSSHDGR